MTDILSDAIKAATNNLTVARSRTYRAWTYYDREHGLGQTEELRDAADAELEAVREVTRLDVLAREVAQ